jgi:S1-C subfamily serine protease
MLPSSSLGNDTSLIERMQKAKESLVEIKTIYARTLRTKSGRTGIASYERHGTGIIIDPTGIIVTNTHIIVNAPRILVGLSNGKAYEAKILYASEADFSFIKIETSYPLAAVQWADSSEAQLGQSIIALGNSEFNHFSILGGEITSLIESMSTNTIELLELNLNLYQGDSGGPILDNNGQLLGLIMAKRKTQDRKSYAIASNKIRQEYLKLKQNMP